MRLLLDTHVVLWSLGDPSRLSPAARALLEDPENECWVSAASLWEIAIKARLGRGDFAPDLDRLAVAVDASGLRTLDVTPRHALATARIETPHADPFDRMLLAQCEVETMRLLSADRALRHLPVCVPC